MSVREEEQKKNCPSRGLGLAAAAIGVGVGAALYYFFNKQNESRDSESSTSQEWACDHQQTLQETRGKMPNKPIVRLLTPKANNKNNNNKPNYNSKNNVDIETPQSDKSYFTVSENTTTDTSMDMDSDISDDSLNNVTDDTINNIMDDSVNNTIDDSQNNITDDSLENTISDSSAITVDSTDLDESMGDSDDFNTDNEDEIESQTDYEDEIESETDEVMVISDEQSDSETSFETDDDEEVDIDELSTSDESDSDVSNDQGYINTAINNIKTANNVLQKNENAFGLGSNSSNTPNNGAGTSTNASRRPPLLTSEMRSNTNESEVDISGWDVTEMASGVPQVPDRLNALGIPARPMRSIMVLLKRFNARFIQSTTGENRERSWSLEECAICFEIMLKDQPLMSLPCTHNFHVQCIGPWLREKHTCPVCRKAAE